MAITMDGVELGVAITEKAAEKIKYFAEKEGISTTWAFGWRSRRAVPASPMT